MMIENMVVEEEAAIEVEEVEVVVMIVDLIDHKAVLENGKMIKHLITDMVMVEAKREEVSEIETEATMIGNTTDVMIVETTVEIIEETIKEIVIDQNEEAIDKIGEMTNTIEETTVAAKDMKDEIIKDMIETEMMLPEIIKILIEEIKKIRIEEMTTGIDIKSATQEMITINVIRETKILLGAKVEIIGINMIVVINERVIKIEIEMTEVIKQIEEIGIAKGIQNNQLQESSLSFLGTNLIEKISVIQPNQMELLIQGV